MTAATTPDAGAKGSAPQARPASKRRVDERSVLCRALAAFMSSSPGRKASRAMANARACQRTDNAHRRVEPFERLPLHDRGDRLRCRLSESSCTNSTLPVCRASTAPPRSMARATGGRARSPRCRTRQPFGDAADMDVRAVKSSPDPIRRGAARHVRSARHRRVAPSAAWRADRDTTRCARRTAPGQGRRRRRHRARASCGVDGTTIFRPGVRKNHGSVFCEWYGPAAQSAHGIRITIGTIPQR